MTRPDPMYASLLLGQMQEVLHAAPEDIAALCSVGLKLSRAGMTQEARKCYRAAVDALRRAARAGDVHRALAGELWIYNTFVKSVEDEQHYYRCFADWKDDLAALGRRFRNPSSGSNADPNRIGFFLHTGHVLGHTEVLLKLLQARPRSGESWVEPRIYVLEQYDSDFVERCRALEIEVALAEEALGPGAPLDARFRWLRERFARDRVGVCVWVSVPPLAAYALSMQLAPVQIFWALRFHPITGTYIDGYITYGAKSEQSRVIGKQSWRVCPVPLAIGAAPEPSAVSALRQRLPQGFLMGTLARPEKINSEPFLSCVAEILKTHPHTRYLWAGSEEHPGIANFFRAQGVAERCHFVGWVDTRLYVSALDLFLESFPIGTGVVPYQALAAGVPLLSYFSDKTVFGINFWHELQSGSKPPDLERYPILCARTPQEYIQLANELICNPERRARVAARGRRFFEEELDNCSDYARRFFETIHEIAEGARAPTQVG